MENDSNPKKISHNLTENDHVLKESLGIGTSYDIDFREISIRGMKVHLYYLNGMCDDVIVQDIIIALLALNDHRFKREKRAEVIGNQLAHFQVEQTNNLDEAVDQLLSGLVLIFLEERSEGHTSELQSRGH